MSRVVETSYSFAPQEQNQNNDVPEKAAALTFTSIFEDKLPQSPTQMCREPRPAQTGEKEATDFITQKGLDFSTPVEQFKQTSQTVKELTEFFSGGNIKQHEQKIDQALTSAYRQGGQEAVTDLLKQISINLDLRKDGMGISEKPNYIDKKHPQARSLSILDKNDREVAKFSWWPDQDDRLNRDAKTLSEKCRTGKLDEKTIHDAFSDALQEAFNGSPGAEGTLLEKINEKLAPDYMLRKAEHLTKSIETRQFELLNKRGEVIDTKFLRLRFPQRDDH